MKEMNNATLDIDAEKEKLKILCGTITTRGDAEYEKIVSEAKKETEEWVAAQESEIEKQAAAALASVEKHAAEVSARQISDAKGEAEREKLKLLSECVSRAKEIFSEKLAKFSNREDYSEILKGLEIEAAASLPHGQEITVRPSSDGWGVEVSTEDGRWKIVSDRQAKVEELADTIAERVLSAL